MNDKYTVTFNGTKYTYDGRGWYDHKNFMASPTALISDLERMLPENVKKDILIERHKYFLAKRKLPYKGINDSISRKHRVTHCYVCKEHLDNLVDLECSACGWIICTCGACGCGRL